MSTVWHYNDTPLPVGLPVSMNGTDGYQLGLYDGALYDEQYADEPDEGVLFQSPDAAREWLATVNAVLHPYIESGNRDARIPDSTGWAVD